MKTEATHTLTAYFPLLPTLLYATDPAKPVWEHVIQQAGMTAELRAGGGLHWSSIHCNKKERKSDEAFKDQA